MARQDKMPLKTFWEAVEQRLAACSADELRAILQAMAQATPPSQRLAFLQKLVPPQDAAMTAAQIIQQADLLAEIDDLQKELQDTMKAADYWEERSGWNDYYDDEDSLGPYHEFVEPISNLFDRTAAAFDYGELALAQAAYQKLFVVLSLEDDYGRGVHADDLMVVDLNEANSRYLRAVYELQPLERRPSELFEQMRSGPIRTRPMLNDLIQISPQPLPEQAEFLPAWIAYLRPQKGLEADNWLREAVWLSQGVAGLEALARTEGIERPRAYLDWFTAMADEGKHHAVLQAAQEALQVLPADLPIRAAVADHLCQAAIHLNQTEVLLSGRWEAFRAKPTLARLLDLWEASPHGDEQTRLMRQAAEHIQEYQGRPPSRQGRQGPSFPWLGDDGLERPAVINNSMLTHAWLLAGEFEAAYELAVSENVLGWSSHSTSQGLVVAAFLILLSGKTTGVLPPNLSLLWQWNLQSSAGVWYSSTDSIYTRLELIYAERLSTAVQNKDMQDKFLSWCLDVAQQRAVAIVGNQYRGSYNKAATVTVACAEVLRLRGDQGAANRVVDDIRNRFPRHRAFQAELKDALQRMERDLS